MGAGLGLAAGATGAYLVHENGADKGTNIAATVGGVWLTFITGAIGAIIIFLGFVIRVFRFW